MLVMKIQRIIFLIKDEIQNFIQTKKTRKNENEQYFG